MLSALLIYVGIVTADDVVQDCEFLNALIIGFDFSEGQGATAHDVTKTGRNASLKHTVWLNDRTFGKILEFATATSCATLNRSLAVGEAFTVAYGKLSVCCLDGSVIALKTPRGTGCSLWEKTASLARPRQVSVPGVAVNRAQT